MSDTIHNLKVVREALEAEGLTVHVKLIDQAIEDISSPPQVAKPNWCQSADAICHHPACTCVLPQGSVTAKLAEVEVLSARRRPSLRRRLTLSTQERKIVE